jgi:hypothetical protein
MISLALPRTTFAERVPPSDLEMLFQTVPGGAVIGIPGDREQDADRREEDNILSECVWRNLDIPSRSNRDYRRSNRNGIPPEKIPTFLDLVS